MPNVILLHFSTTDRKVFCRPEINDMYGGLDQLTIQDYTYNLLAIITQEQRKRVPQHPLSYIYNTTLYRRLPALGNITAGLNARASSGVICA